MFRHLIIVSVSLGRDTRTAIFANMTELGWSRSIIALEWHTILLTSFGLCTITRAEAMTRYLQ